MRRARKANYNGLVITDYKFGRFEERPAAFFRNLARTRKTGEELGLELIPVIMPVGYSNSLLQNDPNLAEGFPVRDAPFSVHAGQASLSAAPLLTADFEGESSPWGFDWVDGPGRSAFRDTAVRHDGGGSLRFSDFSAGNEAGNARIVRKLRLTPHRQYHASLWIRTEALAPAGELRVAVLGRDGRPLQHANLGVRATQDWTEHHAVFNSLDETDIHFYIGLWGGTKGRFWIDDVAVRECAGVNLLRREGCPVQVVSEDNAVRYEEGRDFKPWNAPETGRVPYAGEYAAWHPEPPLQLAAGSRIQEGRRLKVSYHHAQTIYDGAVACCLRHPDIFRLFEAQITALRKHWAPKTWFLAHDELRVAGRCDLCATEGTTAGEVLAEHMRRCVELVRRDDPGAELLVWNDMFDPHHNAVPRYYLVGSTLENSWEGLASSVGIANWNGEKAGVSLRFFADRGHRQLIAGYYDDPDIKGGLDRWRTAARGLKAVDGLMYTTWENRYEDLEAFAREAGF